MPIAYEFNQERSLLRTTAQGLMTSGDIIKHLEDISLESAIGNCFSEIVNMSEIEDLEFRYSDSQEIASLVEKWQVKGHSLTIFWADNQKSMEITEFLIPLFRKIGLNIQICGSEKEANSFLGFLQQYA